MKIKFSYISKVLSFLAFLFAFISSNAQVHPIDTVAKKPKRADYSFLLPYPEYDTKIIGTINKASDPQSTSLYPKGELFSDSFHILNTGAKFELLNDSLPLSKNFDRIFIKVLSNPPANMYAGEKGWVLIDHTSLFEYQDRNTHRVDTNLFVNKYIRVAASSRIDAAKTTCPDNKKCYMAWAEYYDCMAKNSHYPKLAQCPMPNCAIKDCSGDK